MAFNNSFTAVTGATYTASQYNTHTRDNLTAIWVYTTAGDMAYATGSTTLNRLAIGDPYDFMQVNAAGNAPQWGGLHFAVADRSSTQNAISGADTTVAWNQDVIDEQGWHDPASNNTRMTVGVTGYYQASVYLEYFTSGGSGTYRDLIYFKRNGTTVYVDSRYQERDANGKEFSITTPPIAMTAAQYLEIIINQSSGATATLQIGSTFSLWRVG